MIDIQQVWLSEDAVWVRTADGREAYERLSDYPRLKNADRRQLEVFETDGFGISWPELDEYLSFECFFKQKQKNVLYERFMSFPELNASAVARRTGKMASGKSLTGHVAAFVAYAIFGFNIIVCKDLTGGQLIPPLGIFTLRSVFAGVMFWIVSLFLPHEKVERKDYIRIFAARGFEQKILFDNFSLEKTFRYHRPS